MSIKSIIQSKGFVLLFLLISCKMALKNDEKKLIQFGKQYIKVANLENDKYVIITEVENNSSRKIYTVSAGVFENLDTIYFSNYYKSNQIYIFLNLINKKKYIFPQKENLYSIGNGLLIYDPLEWMLVYCKKSGKYHVINSYYRSIEEIPELKTICSPN